MPEGRGLYVYICLCLHVTYNRKKAGTTISDRHGEKRDHERGLNLRRQSMIELCCRRRWRKDKATCGTLAMAGTGGPRNFR